MTDQSSACGINGVFGGCSFEDVLSETESEDDEYMGPFDDKDLHLWPDLYSEIDEMLRSSSMIYTLTELRRQAYRDDLPSDVLVLPMSYDRAIEIMEQYKTHLSREHIKMLSIITKATQARESCEQSTPIKIPTTIVEIDDLHERLELVYAIEVDDHRKRVIVTFRGSVTKNDWLTDIQIYMREVYNPLHKKHQSQKDSVRIHSGFHEYLFRPSSCGAKGPRGQDLSEYQEIMYEHVLPVLEENPDYKLYVTGHSLGAALATLFGFEAAALPDKMIPKPVSVFSIASPYVGDDSFRSAHQLLESQGKLRHLRISNHMDPVTIIPKISFRFNIFDRNSKVGIPFKGVGMNIRLFRGFAPIMISYPKVKETRIGAWWEEMKRGWDQSLITNCSLNPSDYYTMSHHLLPEYHRRLEANKPSLESITLNELYARPDIVGYLVPQF